MSPLDYADTWGGGSSTVNDQTLASTEFDQNEFGMQGSFQQPPSEPTDVIQSEANKNQGVNWGAWQQQAATGLFNLGAAAFAKNQGLTTANGGQSVPRKSRTGQVLGDGASTSASKTQTTQASWLPLAVLGGLAYAAMG